MSGVEDTGNPLKSSDLLCLDNQLVQYGDGAITYANPPSSYIAAGKLLFAQTCSSCHGADANGVNPQGKATIGPNLQGVGAATVDFWVSTGRMPATDVKAIEAERKDSRLTSKQALELAAFVNSLDPSAPAVPTPHLKGANLAIGADLFSLNCAACHTITGAGDALAFGTNAPSLQNRSVTPQQVTEAMRIGPANMPRFSGNLSDSQVRDVVAYVTQEIQHPASPGGAGLGGVGPVAEGFVALLDRRGWAGPHLLLDRRAHVSDADHEPSRTKVPMPIATLDDPHLGDAARNPERVESIIGVIFLLGIFMVALFGAAYWQNLNPWILGGSMGAGLFLLGFGLTAWGKYLMPQGPFVEERHVLASARSKSAAPLAAALVERSSVVVKRRKMLGGLFAIGSGIFGIVAVFPLLRSLGPVPGTSFDTTDWRKGSILVDTNGRAVHKDTLVDRRHHDGVPAGVPEQRAGAIDGPDRSDPSAGHGLGH